MTTTDPTTTEAAPATKPETTLDDVAQHVSELADEVTAVYGLVTKLADRQPTPWPWVMLAAMWASVAFLTWALVRYLPADAWTGDQGYGLITVVGLIAATICTYKLIVTRRS